jgi:hypothetical protein
MELTSSDYNKIIDFYNIDIPNNKSKKDIAEDILSSKLCKCIKKVKSKTINEKAAIAICRKNIFKNRNIDFYNFKCKKSSRFVSKKGTKKKLHKFSKKINFKKKRKTMKKKLPA